ncbi:MAG: TRAP transporter substrate-binding protein, partial [Candidatus Methylomirabilia bacterium]
DNFKMFAKRVDQMSGGRLKIETLPAGAIVPAFQVVDATSKGVLDGAHTAARYLVGKHRAAIPLSHGPLFGMDYIDFFGWYYNGGGNELKNEWYQNILKFNVVAFPILPAGPQALGWFKKRVKNWDDFKGHKYRIYGLGNEVFKDAGMAVVTLPEPEILPALERGTIDGAEWVGGIEDLKKGFHNIVKVHLTPGMHEPVTVGDLVINKDVWNKLPPDLQAIVEAAVVETFWRWFTWWHSLSGDAYKTLVEKHGVNVYRTPKDILVKFVDGWEKLRKKDAAADPFYAKVIESQRKYAEKVVPYRRSVWPDYNFLSDYYWKDKIFLKE